MLGAEVSILKLLSVAKSWSTSNGGVRIAASPEYRVPGFFAKQWG